MAMLIDCNIVIIHLKNAKKNSRIDICRGNFELIQNSAILIDKHFETIYYFPESFSNHEVQAHMKNNSSRMFPSVHKCLCSLNHQRQNVVLVDNTRAYATDKTDRLLQIFQTLSNKYGQIFDFEYDAVNNCLKLKTKSKNGEKDVISLKHAEKFQGTPDCCNTQRKSRKTKTGTRKRITVLVTQRKMKEEFDNKKYFPKSEKMVVCFTRPIFRTNDRNPAVSLMALVNSNIDPYSLSEVHSSLGQIVSDCAGPDSIVAPSTPPPQPSHQTHTRDYAAHNATVSNNNPSQLRQIEEDCSSGSNPPSVHTGQEQNGNRLLQPKYPRYSTYDARIASYATFREFSNIDTKELATTGLFYTGKEDEVQCFQCGIEHRNWRPNKDPLLEHIKESPDCLFLETHLGGNTLNQYKAQIRLSGKISGRESFSNSSTNGGATGGTSDPVFTASDHIRSPQYQSYRVRLSTFTRWPPSMTQKPEQVAQAGFYYTGLDDVVRCFACDGGLKNWDPEDEPWIEHARWFQQCPFVQKVKGQEFIDLVKRMTEESDEEEDAVVHSTFQRNNPMANLPNSQHLNVGNSTDEPSQLDTNAAQTVIQTGYSRSAVAIAIDVLISKGNREYTAQDIMEIILEKEDRGEPLPTDSDSELTRIPSIPSTNEEHDTEHDAGDTENILRKNKSLKSIITCIKCKAQARNTLFLPCSHHCLCQVCAEKCSLCPVCYKVIKQKIKTFMI